MGRATLNETADWLRRPLCRRYAFVQLGGLHVPELDKGAPHQRHWCWAFAMFVADEFEILGAWPTDTASVGKIADDLRNRGVLSIRVMSLAEDGRVSSLSLRSLGVALRNAEPRVLEVLRPQSLSDETVETVPSAAIRSALDAAGRIHGGLVRGVRSRAPFPSVTAASEFVGGWLQRADRRLYEARRPITPAVAYAA